MSEVQLSEISIRFNANPALDGLSLKVRSNEYFVLLGASGCGKTTTLNLIAGLLKPDSGTLSIGGVDVTSVPPKKRNVSMVFQGNALYPHLTIRESLAMGLKNRCNRSERDQRIEDTIRDLGLQNIIDRKPEKLSGGELRRASLAKAYVRRCPVRLLDEPLSALDSLVKTQIHQTLLSWHQSVPGTTIHVTHDGSEAMRMADRIAVIHNGRIAQCGTPQEIYHHPNCKTAAIAVGAYPYPISFLAGKAVDGKLQIEGCNAIDLRTERAADSIHVGVRAADCRHPSPESPPASGLIVKGHVANTHFVDGENYAQIESSAGAIYARITASVGAEVSVFVSRDSLHVYDQETQERLELT